MSDGLYGGRWVPVRGVMRWVPSEAHRAPQQAPTLVPEPRDVSTLVACPVCRATLADYCRKASGAVRIDHVERLVSRRCACGERPWSPLATYCDACRAKAVRRSKREQRRRQAERGGQVAA